MLFRFKIVHLHLVIFFVKVKSGAGASMDYDKVA